MIIYTKIEIYFYSMGCVRIYIIYRTIYRNYISQFKTNENKELGLPSNIDLNEDRSNMADKVGVAQVALGVSKDWRYMNKLLKTQFFSKI